MSQFIDQLSEFILADGFDMSMSMEKSHGSFIVDELTGKEYLDMFSMFGSMTVGYNHPYLLQHANWLGKLSVNKPTMSDVYNKEYSEFIKTFSGHCMTDYLDRVFFISGGALAVENALKASFDWKVQKNIQKGINNKGHKVIHFKQAFHGRSGYTLSLTNTADPRKTMFFPKFDWPRIINPKLSFPITNENLRQTKELETTAINQIKEAYKTFKDDIAAIIIEPIQAEGGDNHFRPEFLQELRTFCDEEESLLIFDEVQTGIGLTGKMWAHQHFDVQPDLLSFGKKTQVCGILGGKKLDEVEKNVFRESSRINSTFGGNFIDMMRFKLILNIVENERLIENSTEKGKYLLDKVELLCKNNEKASNARGKGLMVAFDLTDGQCRDQLRKDAFKKQLLILACGTKSIRFRPHLNVSKQEIDQAISILDSCM